MIALRLIACNGYLNGCHSPRHAVETKNASEVQTPRRQTDSVGAVVSGPSDERTFEIAKEVLGV